MGVFSIKRKDGTYSWYYDFMYNGVRYRNRGGTTKTQAIRALDKKRSEVFNDDHGLVIKIGNPKIDSFAAKYLARRKHLRFHKRDALSVRKLLSRFKGKKLLSITASDIEDYITFRMSDGLSNATINRELACLKRMFSLAIKWGDAKYNPVKDIDFLEEPPGRTRFLSIDEAQSLIFNASDHLKPIIITALNTGMRLSEILSLKWNQVHIENVIDPMIEITETKNNKKRFIPLNETTVELLKSIRTKNTDSEYVFLGTHGKALSSVRKPFIKALQKTGIQDFRFHDLRHTFASHYVMSGGDMMSLKEVLGHSNLRMVERYSHLASAYKRKMINNLNGKFDNCQIIAKCQKSATN
jgi:site-specific recombinase XerD